ncbi:uncharacterized protein LOC119665941 [Teleopsis dalmanni]|uniref:uncharacterized protein LOC119665941 n=1 Tax=Teleopsis dalmanni TaxID=139649 RepID=UPI0018CFE5A6|nr:uncharacterized protein LOC119665941 [Teleopsis dalmanni]
MSNDPNDFEALTPGHFLIGEALTAPASTSTPRLKISLLTRWKLVSHIKHEFWRRWNSEYLTELQYRHKWREQCNNLQENTLVIMKDGSLPPLQWSLGRVTNIYKGSDGMVRVVDIKTASGTLRRAVYNLAPLFYETNDSEDDKIPPVQPKEATKQQLTASKRPIQVPISSVSSMNHVGRNSKVSKRSSNC